MLRSVSSIVIAPARTGSLVTKSRAVIETAQRKRGIRLRKKVEFIRAQATVDKKLIDPKIELAPAI